MIIFEEHLADILQRKNLPALLKQNKAPCGLNQEEKEVKEGPVEFR